MVKVAFRENSELIVQAAFISYGSYHTNLSKSKIDCLANLQNSQNCFHV